MRTTARATALLGVTLLLAACNGGGPAPSTDQSKAEEAAAAFYKADTVTQCEMKAGETETSRAECKKSAATTITKPKPYDPADFSAEPHTAQAQKWRNGYGVLLAFTPKGGTEQYGVYGVVPENGSWKIAEWNFVTAAEKNQSNVICAMLSDPGEQC
ncbi:hypothetical protein ARZXY2_4943 (plasmid) [Arthrobacter sp. ZXY-2]|nr:hypothetical protein ARZXY2_4943 [Arthrobacter sp. ZXY-2]